MYQFTKSNNFDFYKKLKFVTESLVLFLKDGPNISTNTHFISPQTAILDHSTVIFGNNVTIDCHVTGIPPPKTIWLLNDVRSFHIIVYM